MVLATVLGCGPEQPFVHGASRAELRPTDTSAQQMFRFEPTDVVQQHALDGGDFVVHFTRSGRNGTLSRDANDSGVPDYVEDVARVYEEVGAQYLDWGYRAPLRDGSLVSNGGDDRFDVYLLDFGGSADGAFRRDACLAGTERCIGFMVQENDFTEASYPSTEEATRILGSHEFFHAVQASYDADQDVIVTEGTAVWATEEFDPASNDFENFIGAFLRSTDRSLDAVVAGPAPPSAYGSALFFKFLTERHGREIIKLLWEHLENGRGHASESANQANPTWLIQLDAILRERFQSSFAAEFERFSTWNLFTGAAADPAKAWRDAARFPTPTFTASTAPLRLSALRSFYASTQYFRVPVAGRASMVATLSADAQGVVVVGASRRAGKNLEARRLDAPLDTSTADELLIAVINTVRAPEGAVLSRRPNVCVGTLDECAPSVDAGMPVALEFPAAQQPLPAAPACSVGMSKPLLSLLLLLLLMRSP